MNWIYRILICIVVATLASALYYANFSAAASSIDAKYRIDVATAIWFCLTAILCVLLTQLNLPTTSDSKGGNGSRDSNRINKQVSNGTRETGEVKWFNGGKGFGFISCDNGDEIFVHFRSVRKNSPRLSPGKRVEFSIGQGKKGAGAEDVEVVS